MCDMISLIAGSGAADMKIAGFTLTLCAILAGCVSTPPPAPEPLKPEVVGKVSSQEGKCFFKDPAGKVFIDNCPA
jgi:starvation-inducible outer membrane lipoprotein